MTLNTLANNAIGTIVVPGDWSVNGNALYYVTMSVAHDCDCIFAKEGNYDSLLRNLVGAIRGQCAYTPDKYIVKTEAPTDYSEWTAINVFKNFRACCDLLRTHNTPWFPGIAYKLCPVVIALGDGDTKDKYLAAIRFLDCDEHEAASVLLDIGQKMCEKFDNKANRNLILRHGVVGV